MEANSAGSADTTSAQPPQKPPRREQASLESKRMPLTVEQGQLRIASLRPQLSERIDLANARGRRGETDEPSRMPGEPAVWVGSGKHAKDVKMLRRLGITAVLNLAPSVCKDPLCAYRRAGIAYHAIDARDDKSFALLDCCLARAVDFIHANSGGAQDSGGVLVHCMAGCNRSAAIAVAHLMLRDERSLLELFAECSAARPSILQNTSFQLQLCQLAASRGLLFEVAQ